MDLNELMPATLASEQRRSLTPVQIQKLFFAFNSQIARFIGLLHSNSIPSDFGTIGAKRYRAFDAINGDGLAQIGDFKVRSLVPKPSVSIQASLHPDQ